MCCSVLKIITPGTHPSPKHLSMVSEPTRLSISVFLCRGQGSNPSKPEFFRLSFRNGIS